MAVFYLSTMSMVISSTQQTRLEQEKENKQRDRRQTLLFKTALTFHNDDVSQDKMKMS